MNKFFHFIFRHSTIVIILTILLTALFGYSMKDLKIDPSAENLVPSHSKVTELLEKYGTESSSLGYFLVAIESDNIFDLEGLQAFEKAISEIENLPGISPGINPFSTFNFTKSGRRLSIESLAPEGKAPRTEEELENFKNNIIGNPFYSSVIISEDGRILCAIFPSKPLTDEAAGFMAEYNKIKSGLENYYNVYTTGDVPISDRSNQYIMSDLFKLFILALVFMMISFYFGFKSKRSFLLPMSVVLMGTIWTLGFMAMMGYQVNMISLTIPPLVLTIGSSYTIHILNQYYRDAQPNSPDKKWIIDATVHINKTIILACLTTVVGFISLLFTSLSQTKEFGISTSFGIISTMLLSVFYLPAVLSKIASPSARQKDNVTSGLFAKAMQKLGLWVIKFRYFIIAAFVIIIGLFIYAYPKVPAQEDYLSYFPDDDVVVNETSYIISNIGGFQALNITLTAPADEKNFFLQPEVLKKVSDFEQEMLKDEDVTSVSSIAFFIAELNHIMNGKREIPENKALINLLSRYLKLLKNSENSNEALAQLSNEDFSQITITLKVFNSSKNRVLAEAALRKLINRMDGKIESHIAEFNPELWSADLRFLYLSELLSSDQTKSTLIAIAFVFVIAIIAFRNLKYGILTLIPLICGLMLNFIFMAFIHIPLDMITLMVTSIVIGVGVDDAIHYNIQFRKNLKRLGVVNDAIEHTHIEAGRPIMHTTVSIVGGLLFLLLSNFLGIAYFGLLICFTLTFTMLGTLVLLPAVIAVTFKSGKVLK